jgi:hypothetical protein
MSAPKLDQYSCDFYGNMPATQKKLHQSEVGFDDHPLKYLENLKKLLTSSHRRTFFFFRPKKIIFLRECYTNTLRGFIMKEIMKKNLKIMKKIKNRNIRNITIIITILFVRGEREKK